MNTNIIKIRSLTNYELGYIHERYNMDIKVIKQISKIDKIQSNTINDTINTIFHNP